MDLVSVRVRVRVRVRVEEERGVGPARGGGEGSRAEELVGDLARGDIGEAAARSGHLDSTEDGDAGT